MISDKLWWIKSTEAGEMQGIFNKLWLKMLLDFLGIRGETRSQML